MAMKTLDYIFIGTYILFLMVVICRDRKIHITIDNFAVDQRNKGWLVVFATLAASFIGPGYTIGISEQGNLHGMGYLLILIPFSIQTIFVGYFIAPKLRSYEGAYTVGDIMGYHYGIFARIITGLISLLFCAGIVGVIGRVGGLLLETYFELPLKYGVTIITLFVVIYSSLGGIKAVIKTDNVQFVVLSLTILIFAVIVILKFLSNNQEVNFVRLNQESLLSGLNLKVIIGLMFGFLLGETLVPPYTNRAFVSKGMKQAKLGFIAAGLFSIIWFGICLCIGIYAFYFFPEIRSENAFMHVGLNLLPIGLRGLLVIALISIVMSSQDSYLNAASVAFVRDLYEPFKIEKKNSVLIARVVTFLIGMLGIIFAINAPGIISAIMINYTLWAPTIVLPLVIAILLPGKVKPIAGLSSMIAGGLTVLLWKFTFGNPFSVPEIIPGVIINQAVFWIFNVSPIMIQHKLLKRSTGVIINE